MSWDAQLDRLLTVVCNQNNNELEDVSMTSKGEKNRLEYQEVLAKRWKEILVNYRKAVEKFGDSDREKLGWGTSMAHDGLTKTFSGLDTISKYIDTWYFNEDINKCYFKLEERLIRKSHKVHQQILALLLKDENLIQYDQHGSGDVVNAIDYQLVTEITKNTRKEKIERILDFGGGYGRQANLYCGHKDFKDLTVVEAIEDSYVTQSIYLKAVADLLVKDCLFHDELIEPLDFESNGKKINHLLTPNMILLPDKYYDLIICSNVLDEITEPAFIFAIKEFSRVLKSGGILYIKDHGLMDQPGHNFFDDDVLKAFDFTLEYRPFVKDLEDIWTVPRIYRKFEGDLPSFLRPAKYIKEFPLNEKQSLLKKLVNIVKS